MISVSLEIMISWPNFVILFHWDILSNINFLDRYKSFLHWSCNSQNNITGYKILQFEREISDHHKLNFTICRLAVAKRDSKNYWEKHASRDTMDKQVSLL